MKKIGKRTFLKGMGAALAMAVIPFVPKLPEIPVEESVPEVSEPAQHRCKDWLNQPVIQDYSTGETIKYQDLNEYEGCKNCLHEPHCLLNGQKFERYGDGTGRFFPEQFNKRCMNKLYQNTIFGEKI